MKAVLLRAWSRWQYRWHRRKNRRTLVRSLARRDPSRPATDEALWSLYRLGMYASAAAAPLARRLGWRGWWARAVSCAAAGQLDAARAALADFERCPEVTLLGARLADDLEPYLPAEALHLLQASLHGATPAQRVALLLRNDLPEQARAVLDALPPQASQRWPELHLLRSNAVGGAPQERLSRLNAFLQAHGVPPVQLRDANLPPSPMNLCAAPARPVQGPLVSVLMTTFRTGARASAAIESVLAQSHADLELIVIDDASGDDTPERVRAWAGRDRRVRLVELPRNVGTYAAKLIGLRQARGEFVTCHDSDDWSHPEKIARQVAPLLASPRLVATESNWVRMQDDGLFYTRLVHPLMRVNPSSLLFRRERVLREAGAWDCVRTGADSEFSARLRMVFGPRAVKRVAQPLALGGHRPDSLMTSAATGYAEGGTSLKRLGYWEAWARWHIETLARGQRPFVTPDVAASARQRPFAVADELRVSACDLDTCLLKT